MYDNLKIPNSMLKVLTKYRKSSQPSELFEVDSRPDFCTKCNSQRILEIVYGHRESPIPLGDGYVLGGCVLWDDDPNWECGDCNAQFVDIGEKPVAMTVLVAKNVIA